MNKILVTGGTGFVGSSLCKKLLEDETNFLFVIGRGKGNRSARDRVLYQLSKTLSDKDDKSWRDRIEILEGDIEKENIGLCVDDYEKLQSEVTSIFHCAASIKFSLSYEEAKNINCRGTRNLIQFTAGIRNKNFDRLNYVSTAYIAGNCLQGFSENDLNIKQSFSNTYEETKFECELLLNKYIKDKLPITIYRPSIVGSDSINGYTHENNIIYKFIKLFSRGKIQNFYCDDKSTINIVPINYFVNGMVTLSKKKETLFNTYNLVNPVNTNVKYAAQHVCKSLSVKEPKFISFNEVNFEDLPNNNLTHFFKYVKMSHSFKSVVTSNELLKYNITCDRAEDTYFKKTIEYCKNYTML